MNTEITVSVHKYVPFKWSNSEGLTVEKAAIVDQHYNVYAANRPGRHHNIIRYMVAVGANPKVRPEGIRLNQGFLLSDGSFASRTQAASVAIAANQIKELHAPPNLYSEDLW